jgi:PAS domain S-box-containing protein
VSKARGSSPTKRPRRDARRTPKTPARPACPGASGARARPATPPPAPLRSAAPGLRDTGIDVLGYAPWGTHFCQFYAGEQDLVEVLVPYFAAGLRQNERCMWVTSSPLEVGQARRALRRAVPDLAERERRGQITILPHTDWYLIGGTFDSDRVLAGWVAELHGALDRGFEGLRLSGNTFWLEQADWHGFKAYEAAIDGVIGQYRMLALCTYSLEKCGAAEVVDVVQNHEFALIKRGGAWQVLENAERKRTQTELRTARADAARRTVELDAVFDALAVPVMVFDASGCPTRVNAAARTLLGADAAAMTADGWVHVATRQRQMRSRDGQPLSPAEVPVRRVLAGDTVRGVVIEMSLASGGDGVYEASGVPLRSGGQVVGAVVAWHDVTERERARADLADARHRAEALASMVMDINAGRELGEIFGAVLTRMAAVLGGDDGSLYLIAPDGRRLHGAHELTPRRRVGKAFDLEELADSRRALATRRPVYVTQTAARGLEAEWLATEGISASLIVPLLADRRLVGLIYVNFRGVARAPSESDLAFATVFAGQCALAIDRAQLQERAKASYVAALRESEERLATTLHSIADGVIATDTAGRVEDMNPVAERLTGWRLEEAKGRPLDEVFHVVNEDTRAEVESPAHRVLRDGRVVELANHTALIARDGTEVPVADSGAPIRDAAGAVRGVVLVFRDMTEQRRARRAEHRLQRALLTLGECNEVLVRATDEVELLQAICRTVVETAGFRMAWVGYAEDDARRTVRPVAQAGIPPEVLASLDVTWADGAHGRGPTGRAIRGGLPVTARNVEGAADHELWHASAIQEGYAASLALPLRVEGRIIGAVTIYAAEADAFDPDELKLLGEAAEDLAFGIGALRARAARAQMEAQLLFADRMASLGQLSAGVAHEVNNPLAYVMGSLDLAARELTALEEECRGQQPALDTRLVGIKQRVAQMQEAAERIRVVVRDLKVFSRADDEGIGPVDLGQVIDSAINLLANEIRHRARLVRDFGQLPPVRGNDARLGQVFLNLLTNAAQSIPEGETSRHVIRVVGRSRGGQVSVEVRDTGAGIKPEHLPRVFDPFFTTKPLGEGTGLGLSISHGIVKSFGGTITVESEVGKGTTFRVTLPAADPAASSAMAAAPATTTRRRGRVLVIDDEEMMCAVLRSVLSDHEVVALTDARRALDRLAAGERFDVILCDMMMPQMTGMDFHARLAVTAPEQAAGIIFMSGGVFTPRARDFLAAVPNARIEKPFDTQALLELVNGRVS